MIKCKNNVKSANKLKHLIKKTGQWNLIDIFFPKDTHMAMRNRKTCLTLLIIREIQLKTTKIHHLASRRMALIKEKTGSSTVAQDPRGCGFDPWTHSVG